MSTNDPTKKFKKPKLRTNNTTNPSRVNSKTEDQVKKVPKCALLAKDSEWVGSTQNPQPQTSTSALEFSDEEEVLQFVDCEEGPEMKPLALMFPDLVKKDPQTLHGAVNRVMSTTEVTRNLVSLNRKADFTYMKQSNRLIPKDKKWLEHVSENSAASSSTASYSNTDLVQSESNNNKELKQNLPKNENKHIQRLCKPIIITNSPEDPNDSIETDNYNEMEETH